MESENTNLNQGAVNTNTESEQNNPEKTYTQAEVEKLL